MLGTDSVNALTLLRLLPTFFFLGAAFTLWSTQPVLIPESWHRNAGPDPGGLFPAFVGVVDGIAFGIVAEVSAILVLYTIDQLGRLTLGVGVPALAIWFNFAILFGGAFALSRYVSTQKAIRASDWYRGWNRSGF